MDTEKLQRLYDTLEKLRPKGKYGGLGQGGLHLGQRKQHDPTLPNNPLYSNFVRAGAFHKRTFDEDAAEEEEEQSKRARSAEDGGFEENIRKELLKTLKNGRENRKVLQKRIQKLVVVDEEPTDFKKLFKRVVNALIDEDVVELHEDDTLGLAQVQPKKEKKEKKQKKDKKKKSDE
jgi:hypothetical protein